MATDDLDLNHVRPVANVHPNFIKANGNAVASIEINNNMIAQVHGDLSEDQKTLTVKALTARSSNGSKYAVWDNVEKPFTVALDDVGHIDEKDPDLKAQLMHLKETVEDSLKPQSHPVHINPDGETFVYEQRSYTSKDSEAYAIYHGAISENGNATLTHMEFLDKDRKSANGKIELHQPLTINMEGGMIKISSQQLWDTAKQGADQVKPQAVAAATSVPNAPTQTQTPAAPPAPPQSATPLTPEEYAKREQELKQQMEQVKKDADARVKRAEEEAKKEEANKEPGQEGGLGGFFGGIIQLIMSLFAGIGNFFSGMFSGGGQQQDGQLSPGQIAHNAGAALLKDKNRTDGDGKFTREDFVEGNRIKTGKIEYIAGELDLDGNKKISADEWQAAADRVEKGMEIAVKKNGKGEIDEKGTEELKSAMADFKKVLIGFGEEAAKTANADHGLHAKNDKAATKETGRDAS